MGVRKVAAVIPVTRRVLEDGRTMPWDLPADEGCECGCSCVDRLQSLVADTPAPELPVPRVEVLRGNRPRTYSNNPTGGTELTLSRPG